MAADGVTIDLDDDIERWEWRCPRGHVHWEARENGWFCMACARAGNTDPSFDELRSQATGRLLSRREATLKPTDITHNQQRLA